MNEIISLDNLSGYKLGWFLALYHVSLLLPGIGTFIWFTWPLLIGIIALTTKRQLGLGVAGVWLLPHAQNTGGGGCPCGRLWLWLGLRVSVPSSLISHWLLLVLVTCFLRSFVPSHLPKSQPVTSVCFCVSPQSLSCWHFQKVLSEFPYWCVSVLWCVIDILACEIGTSVSKRLFWSSPRKSPGTWLVYTFMWTVKHTNVSLLIKKSNCCCLVAFGTYGKHWPYLLRFFVSFAAV